MLGVAAKRNIAIKITDVLAEINNLKDKMQGLIQVNLRELQRINALPAINEQRKGIVALEEKLNDMEQNGQFLLDKYNKLIRIFNGGNGECNKEILQQAIDLRNEAQQVLRDYTPRQQRQMPAIPG